MRRTYGNLMKVVAIVQARMGSTRLPGKVMHRIGDIPMIELLLRRLASATRITEVVVATSVDRNNAPIVEHVRALGFQVFQGSENDVLARFYDVAEKLRPDVVVRITGDCPLVDPEFVDKVVEIFLASDVDYASNIEPPTFPDGLDIEVFTFQALKETASLATDVFDREHVTPYMRRSGRFRTCNYANDHDFSGERWTVDEAADMRVIEAVFRHFSPRTDFGWREVIALRERIPELFQTNQHINRNEGSAINTGEKLWKRAKKVIPGGNMLLSKRAEMFLPEQWPAYFSKAKGCKVWDLDGREFIDVGLMGIGTNTLGYGHPEVDQAVCKTIEAGNMSTLNCPEEVLLAERLLEMHPWADMARFARSGGEANAIAIRIARAATGKEKVAICGYHGWHDWYLSANLGGESELAGHLLPGLEPRGVPASLRGTTLTFNYNDFERLDALVRKHDIGVIIMEVSRNRGPTDNFLQRIRDLATARGIVLIFDECTSGFRQTYGGLHKQYGVEPDMAVFGKALGNGYAITAVIGRRALMEAAQTTFISSTFWTERIGPTAALKTLEVMEREKSWERITATGSQITSRWLQLAKKHDVPISITGLPALTGFAIESRHALAYKTLITQEMLAKRYLAGTSVYVCTEHSTEVIDAYFDALDPIFKLISDCERGRDVTSLLKGPICHAGFKQLN